MKHLARALKHILRHRRQAADGLLHRTALVRVRPRLARIINYKLALRVVQVEVVVRERRKLRALRRDLARRVHLVLLDLEDVDLGRAAARGRAGPGVVRAGARAGRAALAREPAEVKVVFGAGGVGVQGGRGAGAVRVGLVGERPDVARVVCVRPHPGGGRGVSRSGEIAHRPCAGPVSLRVLVGPWEGGRDLDVPARKAEFVPGLEHARSVGEVVVRVDGEGGG